jgi:hypothetical protein
VREIARRTANKLDALLRMSGRYVDAEQAGAVIATSVPVPMAMPTCA